MMGPLSKQKGKRGEQEVATILRGAGFDDVRRATQGETGRHWPDVGCYVDGVPVVWCECKLGKRPDWRKALAQVLRDHLRGSLPFAACRDDRGEWIVSLRMSDFAPMLRKWCGQRSEARVKEIETALEDAAKSLGVLSVVGYGSSSAAIRDLYDVRGFAGNREREVRKALKGDGND